jgi:predicted dehydrogenase
MKPVSMIIAGAANPHVRNYYRILLTPDFPIKLMAIADKDPERLQYAKDFFATSKHVKPEFYSDWRKMLDKHPGAESVMAGTDNIYHYEVIAEAIKRGKHIYSMKVLSMDEQECEEIIKLRDKHNVVFEVELELHFSPQYRNVREAVRSGKLGKIKSIFLTNVSQSPCNYFPNWGEPELSYGRTVPIKPGSKVFRGGGLTDHPHPFDLINWVTGAEFKRVFAVSSRNQREHLKVEDHIAVTGELDNGAKFFINPSYSNLEEKVPERILRWPKSLEVNLKVTGTKGYMEACYYDKHMYVVGQNHPSPNRLMVDGAGKIRFGGYGGCNGPLECFANAVRGKREVESSAEDGFRAVKVMNAAYESACTGKPVVLK